MDRTNTTSTRNTISKMTEEDKKLFNTMNPETGKRYDIPLLSKTDHNFRENYIVAMRLRLENPEAFSRMLNWH